MNIEQFIFTLLLGILCGFIGQGIRVVIGLYKLDKPFENFNFTRFFLTLFIGAISGSIAAISTIKDPVILTDQAMALIAAGYTGADFIEGFVGKFLPK